MSKIFIFIELPDCSKLYLISKKSSNPSPSGEKIGVDKENFELEPANALNCEFLYVGVAKLLASAADCQLLLSWVFELGLILSDTPYIS